MTISLGLDIGTNSVGSAWVDTKKKDIQLGVTIFPAGVEDSDTKRGDPKNQKRREKRSQRRSIARKAKRKRQLRKTLVDLKLLPATAEEQTAMFHPENVETAKSWDPWKLRVEGLSRELTPIEFGRILIHLNQRRGALGVDADPDDQESGLVKAAISHTEGEMEKRGCRTVGELMDQLREERQIPIKNSKNTPHSSYPVSIRNKGGEFEFHATRQLIRNEFLLIWEHQKSYKGKLSKLLTNKLLTILDHPEADSTWRHQGALFGQRKTYWDSGTLGRCSLEPSDHLCPKADMYASEFLVLETVNRIRIEERGNYDGRGLSLCDPSMKEKRDTVIQALRTTKTPTIATIRKALGIHTKENKVLYSLNIEREQKPELNSDWFHREIVAGVFGETEWNALDERQKESINRAIQKFEEEEKLKEGALQWWGLNKNQIETLLAAWNHRPKPDKRLRLSRRAIKNLLPFMRAGDDLTTAKQKFGYPLKPRQLNKADRHYMEKHSNSLPPAPMCSNPVVRRAIHEVRRHVNAYLNHFQKLPDRIVIEYARSATQSAKSRNDQLAFNRKREAENKKIEQEFKKYIGDNNPAHRIVERVRLWVEQKKKCAYSGKLIGIEKVGFGTDLEVDHIIPRSRGGHNGFSNKVLCYRDTNRNKGNRTPKEWMSADDFEALEKRFEHLAGKQRQKVGVFECVPNKAKWDNLHQVLDNFDLKEFANSQFTDTAYAAKQVATYLREALYPDSENSTSQKQRIFTTKGTITARLRRDWGILEENEPFFAKQKDNEIPQYPKSRSEKKDRSDHRHHAIDAVMIALSSPQLIEEIVKLEEYAIEYKERTGHRLRQDSIKPPWDLRNQVVELAKKQIVAHRPVKRKLTGALHEEMNYGIVDENKKLFTLRLPVEKLTAKMLRMPELIVSNEGTKYLKEPKLEKGGLVRDRNLRKLIRECLKKNQINPDKFDKNDIKALSKSGKLNMPSGVPIKTIVVLRTIKSPIIIKSPNKAPRVFVGGNNHHLEILEDTKTGNWSGTVWDTFTVSQRINPPKTNGNAAKLPMVIGRELEKLKQENRLPGHLQKHYENKSFVMSLAEGEMIYGQMPEKKNEVSEWIGYFVVVKLSKKSIFFAPHWDARRADQQHRWEISIQKLKNIGVGESLPFKVSINPLGTVSKIND
ncbi:MAG: type II CRISPR RNA-guided endonuclease Cas9 [Gimesia sp.]|uniref:CRISPR-associated endonuclease Cas9 n=1 Tax=Gimesia maris TaxID=122 RepID=A0A3D3RGF1_9PLAN|nr:type II CRISPR RNA-guided endonuclease Cas9 [Gimesia sp.]HCO27107.1 type II CRISPR RNA-guided endonuclease Cas9 [Gimesia maris]|tara:strand:+ start:49513 stop:52986 length:3474 start_codon:yes stop_codon:yes gene_type:complete